MIGELTFVTDVVFSVLQKCWGNCLPWIQTNCLAGGKWEDLMAWQVLDVSMRHRLAKFMEEFSLQQQFCCWSGNRSKIKTTLGFLSYISRIYISIFQFSFGLEIEYCVIHKLWSYIIMDKLVKSNQSNDTCNGLKSPIKITSRVD